MTDTRSFPQIIDELYDQNLYSEKKSIVWTSGGAYPRENKSNNSALGLDCFRMIEL